MWHDWRDARSYRECDAEAQHCGGWGADGWFVWLVFASHGRAAGHGASPDPDVGADDEPTTPPPSPVAAFPLRAVELPSQTNRNRA
jgi:hypothetical protein